MITFVMSNVSRERRLAAAHSWFFVALALKRDCDHLLAHRVDGYQDCDQGCIVSSPREAVVALDIWCSKFDLRS